ncbi:MAG: DUF6485 family protein [Nanoarchaeota archaeon]|nr:hypothetical protein [Nanoarchaeota archaeon]MBU1030340.1 hypothetical protein [Nanoarchaeota archaeon]MBU1849800.1 hypothetical protein [Nanoarchaeota archaeon]
MECEKEANKENCNCTYPCEKKGLCCECVSYHRNRKELPACFFPANAEKTYDRSIKNFIKLNS